MNRGGGKAGESKGRLRERGGEERRKEIMVVERNTRRQ
jgi:hypothetical protein